MVIVRNHYGYGLRTDERPFAHKIPPGGNWTVLSDEEASIFWNGKQTRSNNALRRMKWDEPAYTITADNRQKLNCQLHPSHGYEDNQIERRGYMAYNVTPTLPRNGFTVAELFAGGGLMAVGLKESGFEIVWANDFDKRACKSYAYNLGDHIVCGDITEIDPDDIPDVDVIAGGPPCQDYSVAGKGAGDKGDRGKLVWTYLNIIQRKKPKAFLFENVKGLISKKHRPTFDALLEKFDEIGYNVSWKLINAWDYGVAQKRERVFIVGIRKDLGFFFEFPEPAPEDYRTQVLRDVIGDLPEPNHVHYPLTKGAYEHAKKKNIGYNTSLDEPAKTIRASSEQVLDLPANHDKYDGRNYSEKYMACNVKMEWDKPSRTITATGVQYIHPDDTTEPPRNHDRYEKRNYSAYYKYSNLKAEWDKPSNTLCAMNTAFIHPDEPTKPEFDEFNKPKNKTLPRRFTVRECLRIQSVPDWYVIPEDISLSAQYRIVGNGVPSRVAWYLGRALAEQLKKHMKKDDQ